MFALMRNIIVLIVFLGVGAGLLLQKSLSDGYEAPLEFPLQTPLKDEDPVSDTLTSTASQAEPMLREPSPTEATLEDAELQESRAASGTFRFPTEGSFAPVNIRAREALVNIVCEKNEGRVKETTSGSGIIIDPRGFVLTSAHVVHFMLLEALDPQQKITCVLRIGNPARDAYQAELVFITDRWVKKYAPQLSSSEPRGTGEEDFALIYITDATRNARDLPQAFPFLPIQKNTAVTLSEEVLVAGYPIYGINTAHTIKNLYLVSGLAEISELFTFDENSFDLFSINNTIAAEHGVSGGAVVTEGGAVAGIVVTSSADALILNRELNALTLNYIDRRFEEETGTSLTDFLSDDPVAIVQEFKNYRLPHLLELFSSSH
jgi:hypothetical protein